MKFSKHIIAGMVAAFTLGGATSCVDKIAFGNAFLDKAPGADVTKDTVFNKAEYTRNFLWNTYGMLYYGLPIYWGEKGKMNGGMFETLSDTWHSHLSWDNVNRNYYSGAYAPGGADKWDFDGESVWQAVRAAYIFIENVDVTPGIDDAEKKRLKAEAKCIIASRYFDEFRHFGGLPLVKSSYSGTDASYEMPRASVEETVNFMVGLLDEAAADLPWKLGNTPDSEGASDDPSSWDGRFTKATVLGLKCKILAFAASPLFNDSQPYNTQTTATAEQQLAWWYGGYKPELWAKCLQACKDFFAENGGVDGTYHLLKAKGTRPQDYRLAFRKAYYRRGNASDDTNPEMLLSTRVKYDSNYSWDYIWTDFNSYGNTTPTEEYMEMFSWADGTPFVWDKLTETQKKEMFVKNVIKDKPNEVVLTRDPRLYETMIVNLAPQGLDWTTGDMNGRFNELWAMGREIGDGAVKEAGQYATGYGNNKFFMQGGTNNQPSLWPYLRLADVILVYAEALAQNGENTEAIALVDKIRARVGLKGLVESGIITSTPTKDQLINEILNERVRELGLEDTRFYDLIRYKRKDIFEKPLHGLRIYRQKDGEDYNNSWSDKTTGQEGYSDTVPTDFRYEKFQLNNSSRVWWSGFDTKWYLSAFPPTEINKGYGCVQNPGW